MKTKIVMILWAIILTYMGANILNVPPTKDGLVAVGLILAAGGITFAVNLPKTENKQ